MDRENRNKNTVLNILVTVLLTSEIVFLTDSIFTFGIGILIPAAAIPVFMIFVFLFFFLPRFFTAKMKAALCLVIVAGTSLLFLSSHVLYNQLIDKTDYYEIKNSSACFTDRKVMFVVPHEDDDLNLACGMIENYIENESSIYPIFVTNGDYFGDGETRLTEALTLWNKLGVPEENIVFLGYGDQWQKGGPHLYNADSDTEMVSAAGITVTYGLMDHPAYHDGIKYTKNNLLNDLVSIIDEIKPDVIFASDYDNHPDHRASSLLFEKAISIILHENSGYKPIVYKGYAYTTAWCAKDDFYALNILSTTNEIMKIRDKEYSFYDWSKRIRFPVNRQTLSRSIFRSSTYSNLECYDSQDATSMAKNIINGDKVFWQRRTDSLLYDAELTVSSGKEKYLTDFCVLDSDDVNDSLHKPFDGVWTPDSEDNEKAIRISFPEKIEIYSICLYDNPSPTDNILDVVISFSDGTFVKTGALNENGAPTEIIVNKNDIHNFSIVITESEGNHFGLAEIEAFSTDIQNDIPFIKITDSDGNFVYDYYTDKNTTDFSVYSNADLNKISLEEYSVYCSNNKCSVQIIDGRIRLDCPLNEECIMSLSTNDGISDTIHVYHMNSFEKLKFQAFQLIEGKFVYPMSEKAYYDLASYRFIHKLISFVQRG